MEFTMSAQYILPLDHPQADLATVGGKGMSLARLLQAGMPVPGGFHVTTDAYRAFVTANSLQARIEGSLDNLDVADPAALEAASQQIRTLFTDAPIPADVADEIAATYQALDPQLEIPVAVRSSATAEDLPDASFAGQQDTYLNIRGVDAVVNAVRECWASLWTARAIGYRSRQGIDPQGVALAVVVQELVAADAAGIMFTANPLNGKRGEALINAAWGLGEAVVGGLVTPDSLTVEKASGEILERQTTDKQIMTVRSVTGTEEQPVPADKRKQPVLSNHQAVELVKLGAQIERYYEMPMDIEWAWADDRFFILQARPITALPVPEIEWTLPDPKGTFMRGSVVDLLPEPLTPLFATLGIPAMREQMKPMGKRMIGTTPTLTPTYYAVINNYAYMDGNMPPKMLWWVFTSMLPAYPRLLRHLAPLWKNELHPEYQAFAQKKQSLNLNQLTDNELWHEAQELVNTSMYYVCGLQFATMGASAGSELLLTRLYNRWASREGGPQATALLMGWDNIPVRAEKSLYDLAMWAGEQEELAAYILATPTDELVERFANPDSSTPVTFVAFADRFQDHLNSFGYIIYQLDFAEPLPIDLPAPMIENIKMYLRGEGVNPHDRQHASEAKRIQTRDTALTRVKGIKGWVFRKVLGWAQSLAEVREDALAEIGLTYPIMRGIFHELGNRFVTAGYLAQPEDIYWLEKDEIESLLSGEELTLCSHIVERKVLHAQLKQITPPPMMPVKERIMGIKTDVFVAHSADAQTGNILKGVAASPGRVTAPARVLYDPDDFSQMRPGEILVAGTTTPAWTPLFAMAAAVVTDIGGPLSHGSIVAREYGIPAVMGTGVATNRIHSGDSITVDGSTGEVILTETIDDEIAITTWPVPKKGVTYARGSLAEHTPSPVKPLFATLGLSIANHQTRRLWEEYIGADPDSLFPAEGFYSAINDYVYGGFDLGPKGVWALTKMSISQIGPMMRNSSERWHEARQTFSAVVIQEQQQDIPELSARQLLDGACTLFDAAVAYYTVLQTTLPAASMSEVIFTRFYNTLIKRKDDPEATALLFGFETQLVRAEKSLFDIATWLKEQPDLTDYIRQTSAKSIKKSLVKDRVPDVVSSEVWNAWREHLDQHFDQYGRTAYEFDFSIPTPFEEPTPQIEAIKLYLEGQATNPYERLQTAVEKREQATQAILKRTGWPRKNWFKRILPWAQEAGSIREDSIADMGLAHPLIRQMLGELGSRFFESGAIQNTEDIYWLEQDEVEELVKLLDNGQPLPVLDERIPARVAKWQAALKINPPVMLPEKSRWSRFLHGGDSVEKDGKLVLKGIGTSSGSVTAPACVLFGPEDFAKMKPGDVLIAVTTTPAWTPLFAQASAVITDIGGPLSHSSIVAREYGIPAVMAVRGATRTIQSGQTITVDGASGTVTI